MRVLSVTSGRADVGIMTPVWRALCELGAELHVFLTGALVSNPTAALPMLPSNAIPHVDGADMAGRSGAEAAAAMGRITEAAGRLAGRIGPDRVLVVGDRLDMIPAALAFTAVNVPLGHIHGGELSLGALDDRARHAISKLSHLHFVANVDAARRLARMGEEPWRIHVTGAPGLDTLAEAPVLDSATLAQELGFDSIEGLRLVTLHPETNSPDPGAPLEAVLSALEQVPGPTLLTAPNADPGSEAMRRAVEMFASTHLWARFRDTLGGALYANALRHAAVMVGNSSSGIIEAPFFGLPAINVGARQAGRLRGLNVTDCAADVNEISMHLRAVPSRTPPGSPYGDGRSAPRIAQALMEPIAPTTLLWKKFSETSATFTAPWATGVSPDENGRRPVDGAAFLWS